MAKKRRKLSKKEFFTESDMPLAVYRSGMTPDCAVHTHEFSELVLMLSGQCLHVVGKHEWPVAAGDVFVVHAGISHTYRDPHDVDLVNVLFDADALQLPLSDLPTVAGYQALFKVEPRLRHRRRFHGRLRLSPEDLAKAESIVRSIEKPLTECTPGYRFEATAAFMRLVVFLSQAYSHIPKDNLRPLLRVANVLGYLEKNYDHPLTLKTLAGVGHMSLSTLLRVFRQATGTTPIDYLIRLRLRKAAEQLEAGDLSVSDIALQTGFSDQSYFTRAFRRLYDHTPSEHRRDSEQS